VSIAYIGIGSNLDDPRRQVLEAFDELDQLPHSRVVKRSSLYRSAPVGYTAQPDFINAVAQVETALPAERLLAELQQIEARHGRARSFANAPRTLDLDLLMVGSAQLSSTGLTLPHPRMHERAFVLKPLLEISPDAEIPGRGPAQPFLHACSAQDAQRID
jgi:2-amino-4-hydroxy-6-hydroxymethyldihydropteridine diphosphokinase